jgi:hypothetical protein
VGSKASPPSPKGSAGSPSLPHQRSAKALLIFKNKNKKTVPPVCCASAGADRPKCGICAGPAYVIFRQKETASTACTTKAIPMVSVTTIRRGGAPPPPRPAGGLGCGCLAPLLYINPLHNKKKENWRR